MRKFLIYCCVMSLTAATAPPSTQAPSANEVASSNPSASTSAADGKLQPAAEKKKCRNLDAGFSHRTERVCMTAKQWEEYDRGGG
jgi:hypothetical protein